MSERDEFEAVMGWKLKDSQGKHALSRAHDSQQTYTFLATYWAYDAWKASRAARVPQAVPALTDEQIEELWRAYQLGQVSADHTAKEVFFEVMRINLRAMLVTSPAALTDEQILHMAEGIKFDDEAGAEKLVAFVRKRLAVAPPSQELEKTPPTEIPDGSIGMEGLQHNAFLRRYQD